MYSSSRSQGWGKSAPAAGSGSMYGRSSSGGSRMGSSSLGMDMSSSLDRGIGSGTYSSLSRSRLSEPYTGEKREWGYSSALKNQGFGGGSSGSLTGSMRDSAYSDRNLPRRQDLGLMGDRRFGMDEPLSSYSARSSADLSLLRDQDMSVTRGLGDQMGTRNLSGSDSWSGSRDVGLPQETSFMKGKSIMNYFCKVCKIKLLSLKNFSIHASGNAHQRKVNELQYQLGPDFSRMYGDPDEPEAIMESQGDSMGRMDQLATASSAGIQRASDIMQQQPRGSIPLQEMGMSGQQRNMGQFGQQSLSSSNAGQMEQRGMRYDDRIREERQGRGGPGDFRNMTKILDSMGIRDEEGLTNLIGAAVKNVQLPGEIGREERFRDHDRFQDPGMRRDFGEPRMGPADRGSDNLRGRDMRGMDREPEDRFGSSQRDRFQGRTRDDMGPRDMAQDRFDDRRLDDRRRDDRSRRDRERPAERWPRNRSPPRRDDRASRDYRPGDRDRGFKRQAEPVPEDIPFKMRMDDDRERLNQSQMSQIGPGSQMNQGGMGGMGPGNIGGAVQGTNMNQGNMAGLGMNVGNMGAAGMNQGNMGAFGMNQGNLGGPGLNQANVGGPASMQGNFGGSSMNQSLMGPNMNQVNMMGPGMNQGNMMGTSMNQGNMMASGGNQGQNMMGPGGNIMGSRGSQGNVMGLSGNQGNMMMNPGNMAGPNMNQANIPGPSLNMQGMGQGNMGTMNMGNIPPSHGPEVLGSPGPISASVTNEELEIARQIGAATGIGDMSILMQGVRLVKDLDPEVLQSLVGLTNIFEALSAGRMSMQEAARRLPPAVADMLAQGNLAPEVVQMLMGMNGGGQGKPVQSLLDLNLGRARRGRGRDFRGRGDGGRGSSRGRGSPRGEERRRGSPDHKRRDRRDSSQGNRDDRGRGGFRGRFRSGRGFGQRRAGLNRAASGIRAKALNSSRAKGESSSTRDVANTNKGKSDKDKDKEKGQEKDKGKESTPKK